MQYSSCVGRGEVIEAHLMILAKHIHGVDTKAQAFTLPNSNNRQCQPREGYEVLSAYTVLFIRPVEKRTCRLGLEHVEMRFIGEMRDTPKKKYSFPGNARVYLRPPLAGQIIVVVEIALHGRTCASRGQLACFLARTLSGGGGDFTSLPRLLMESMRLALPDTFWLTVDVLNDF